MYYPVRNPYAQPRSSNSCCAAFLVVLLIGTAIVGVYFACTNFSSTFLAADLLRSPELSAAFGEFVSTHNKAYATPEEASYRFRIFAENYRRIKDFNADPEKTCTLEANKFADLTDEEFQNLYLSKPIATGSSQEDFTPARSEIDKNWTDWTTPVKDQGPCGSCWTFSSVSVVETLIALKENKPLAVYAEQELVDCCTGSKYPESNGCNGGEDEDGINYIKEKGIALEADYPYMAMNRKCNTEGLKHIKGIKGQQPLYTNALLEEKIMTRTISVALASTPYVFRFYKSGIITKGCPGESITHAVTVVGAKTENGIPYWLVRNSWGPNWGDKGHLKIMRSDDGCGVCGINCYARVALHESDP